MNSKSSALNLEEIELVYNSIEEFIQEKHQLCYIKDIEKKSGLSKSKCKKNLDFLIEKERVVIIFQLHKHPTIYMPKYMFEGILQLQHKPKWLKMYGFKEKENIEGKIEKLRKDIKHYEIIESLLYGTGKPLEKAVVYCLDLLGLDNVEFIDDPNKHDISFVYEAIKYIIEVKGLTKYGKKEDIIQLDSWIQQELAIKTNDNELKGIIVVNHYRKKDPKERGDPLTEKAKTFMKHYDFIFFTSKFLYDIIREVLNNKIDKENAIIKLIKGEKYE